MTEETPRIHELPAACCGRRIVNFDLPSRATDKLTRRALDLGWQVQPDGTWQCDQHAQQGDPQ